MASWEGCIEGSAHGVICFGAELLGEFFVIKKSLMEGNEQRSKARLVRLYGIILPNHIGYIGIMIRQ